MTGEPTYHTARRRLETERRPYHRAGVNALAADGWGVYAIWGGTYECLYVGKSAAGESVKKRLLAHPEVSGSYLCRINPALRMR